MKNPVKKIFGILIVYIFIFIGTAYSQTVDINGVWRLSTDGKHTIHFMNDGSFLETDAAMTKTGTWAWVNGDLVLTYSKPSAEVYTYQKIVLDGNDLTWHMGDVQTRWVRGVGNTEVGDDGVYRKDKHLDDRTNTGNNDDQDNDHKKVKEGQTNDRYINESKDTDGNPKVDESDENDQNYQNRRDQPETDKKEK